jgi:Transposase IS116/IS110/IS902 family
VSGNNESAGKRKSGKTRKGNKWLRMAMIEAGQAAARTTETAGAVIGAGVAMDPLTVHSGTNSHIVPSVSCLLAVTGTSMATARRPTPSY